MCNRYISEPEHQAILTVAIAGAASIGEGGPACCFQYTHQHAGLQAKAGNIRQIRDSDPSGKLDDIDQVSADIFAGMGDSVDLEGCRAAADRRDQRFLDGMRRGKLMLEPKCFPARGPEVRREQDIRGNHRKQDGGGGKADARLGHHRWLIERPSAPNPQRGRRGDGNHSLAIISWPSSGR
jgi:hypothetical protein